MSDFDPIRDCKHGHQKGKCDSCDLLDAADLIAQQAAEIADNETVIRSLCLERDALKAHVERLREVWQSQGGCGAHMCCMKKPEGIGNNGGCRCYENRSMMHMVTQRMNAVFQQSPQQSPQQSLAERDAEVARKAFIAGFQSGKIKRPVVDLRNPIDLANEYAQRIKENPNDNT